MPLGVPRSSGRASLRYSALSFVRRASYWSHVLMMCSHVCKVSSPHSQSMLFSGKNCFRNSPVYAWPVRHCTRRLKTSRWFWSSVKCFVGLRDGGILLAIANLPLQGALCQSRARADCVPVVALALWRALNAQVFPFD